MQKNFFLFLLLLITSEYALAQKRISNDIENITRVTFLNPGFDHEHRLGKLQSVTASIFMAASFSFSYSSSLGTTAYLSLDPSVALQYRYYYNYKQRTAKGKRTVKNSLNYLGSVAQLSFSKNSLSSSYYVEDKRRPISSLGVLWGFQRNYARHFSLDIALGAGYYFAKSSEPGFTGEIIKKQAGIFSPVSKISLGFWLSNKHSK